MSRSRFRGRSTPRAGRRILFPLLGALLSLPTAALWVGFGRATRSWPVPPETGLALALGAGSFFVLRLFFRRSMTLYVFGHELTHAAAGILSGYKLKSLFVSEKGGEVELSNVNVFVALAPYFVPLYTVIVLLVYGVVRLHAGAMAPPLWVGFGVGLTFTFHIMSTIHALRQHQPDVRYAGPIFSFVAIALGNGAAAIWAFSALSPGSVRWGEFLSQWANDTVALALSVGGLMRRAANAAPSVKGFFP